MINNYKARILIIESNPELRRELSKVLKFWRFTVKAVTSESFARRLLEKEEYDIILVDSGNDSSKTLEFIKRSSKSQNHMEIICFAGEESIQAAVKMMKFGAADYLVKPIDYEELKITLEQSVEYLQLLKENQFLKDQIRLSSSNIIGTTKVIRDMQDFIGQAAATNATVLITGESGVGKELVADEIHRLSSRSDKPFVKVNCAAIPETLLESELFGYERGAFTGALEKKLGRFELADTGTIFLDEIGEIPPTIQIKLLRVLQEYEFERLGGTSPVKVDVRVISATNSDLKSEIEANRFRKDLFFRLNVVPIEIPPLRERLNDIPILVNHFIKQYSEINAKNIRGISEEAMSKLMSYDWPGNIREVQNIIQRAIVSVKSGSNLIELSDLPREITGLTPIVMPQSGFYLESGKCTLAEIEKLVIVKTLQKFDGHRRRTADSLGISLRSLYNKLKDYGITS